MQCCVPPPPQHSGQRQGVLFPGAIPSPPRCTIGFRHYQGAGGVWGGHAARQGGVDPVLCRMGMARERWPSEGVGGAHPARARAGGGGGEGVAALHQDGSFTSGQVCSLLLGLYTSLAVAASAPPMTVMRPVSVASTASFVIVPAPAPKSSASRSPSPGGGLVGDGGASAACDLGICWGRGEVGHGTGGSPRGSGAVLLPC